MRAITRLTAVLLALTLVAAACGGDDDGSAFGDDPVVATDGDGPSSDDSGDDGSTRDFCDVAQDQADLELTLDNGDVNVFVPEELEPAFRQLSDLTDEALDTAPEEIRGDFELIRGELSTVLDTLEAADFDFSAIDLAAIAESPERTAASDRIDAFIEEECGIVSSEDDGPSDEEIAAQAEEAGASGGLVAQSFVAAGLPEDQANCLAESITFEQLVELGNSGGTPPTEFFTALDDCGVSLEQLSALGAVEGQDMGDLGLGGESVEDLIEEMPGVDTPPAADGDIPQIAVDAFVGTLVTEGFTEAEALCLAPTFLGDPAADPLTAFEDCGISLSRLAEIGG